MTKTTVKKHSRKGTKGVKTHSRSIPIRKKVPHSQITFTFFDETYDVYGVTGKDLEEVKWFIVMNTKLGKSPEYIRINLPELKRQLNQGSWDYFWTKTAIGHTFEKSIGDVYVDYQDELRRTK